MGQPLTKQCAARSAFRIVQEASEPLAQWRWQPLAPSYIQKPDINQIAQMGSVFVSEGSQLHPHQGVQADQPKGAGGFCHGRRKEGAKRAL